MERNLYIDASHPNETRVVLKSEENIEDYEYESKKNILVRNNIYLGKAMENALIKNKIPFRIFYFLKKREQELGTIFTFFVLETILLSRLMKLNPFDQPAVENVKQDTKKILLKN